MTKWKIYNDYKYLGTTHFEGFPISAREILIQSRNRLNEEAKANSVTASSSQGVVKSDSSTINYKPAQLINAGSIDVSLEKASRMFHIPIEEMPKQKQKPRKCFVDFQGLPDVDSQREEFLNSESFYNALENNVSSNNVKFCMFKFIDNFCDANKYVKYQNACEIGQDKSWTHDFGRENTKQNLHFNVSKVSHPKNIQKLCNSSLFSADICNKPSDN